MTEKVYKCYKDSINDDGFEKEMLIASPEGNKKPGWLADDLQKTLWALAYYGYIIGKFGSQYAKEKYPS